MIKALICLVKAILQAFWSITLYRLGAGNKAAKMLDRSNKNATVYYNWSRMEDGRGH